MNPHTDINNATRVERFKDYEAKIVLFEEALTDNSLTEPEIRHVKNLIFNFLKQGGTDIPAAMKDYFQKIIDRSETKSQTVGAYMKTPDEFNVVKLNIILPPNNDIKVCKINMYFNINGEGNLRITYRPEDSLGAVVTGRENFDYTLINLFNDSEIATPESDNNLNNANDSNQAELTNRVKNDLPEFTVSSDFNISLNSNSEFQMYLKGRRGQMPQVSSFAALCSKYTDPNSLTFYELNTSGQITKEIPVKYISNFNNTEGLLINKDDDVVVCAVSAFLYDVNPKYSDFVKQEIAKNLPLYQLAKYEGVLEQIDRLQ